MGDRKQGWFILARKLFDECDPFWNERRRFSRWEAWVDMIEMASHTDHERMMDGSLVPIPRGSLVASERFLATRWCWSKSTVHRFIAMLRDMERICPESGPPADRKPDRLTLCNYDTYQQARTTGGPQTGPHADHTRTTRGPNRSKVKKVKEGKTNTTQVDSDFEKAWKTYPARRGGNPKKAALRAWTARVNEGADPSDLIAAVGEYVIEVEAMGRKGTEYVKQAATFFGPGGHWEEYAERAKVRGKKPTPREPEEIVEFDPNALTSPSRGGTVNLKDLLPGG